MSAEPVRVPAQTPEGQLRELEHAHTCVGPPRHRWTCHAMYCRDQHDLPCWDDRMRHPNTR